MGNLKGAINGLTLGNYTEGKDGTNDVPYKENLNVVMEVVDATDWNMDNIGKVMETPPWVLGDEGMGCDIYVEPILLDIVVGWWNKENGGPIMVAILLKMRLKGLKYIDQTPKWI